MAEKNKPAETPGPVPNKRIYVGKIPESKPMDVGKTYQGIFLGWHPITLPDQNTGEEKEIRAYLFRGGDGNKFTILGRTGLDLAFDEAGEQEGGPERLIGKMVEVMRGDDTRLNRGRTFGNYTIAVWEEPTARN